MTYCLSDLFCFYEAFLYCFIFARKLRTSVNISPMGYFAMGRMDMMMKFLLNRSCLVCGSSFLAPQWHHSTAVVHRDMLITCMATKDNKLLKEKKLHLLGTSSDVMHYLKMTKPDQVYDKLIECKVTQSYPEVEVLHLLANFFSIGGHVKGLEAVKSICQIKCLKEFKRSSNFAHYTAQLFWQKGNFKKAMDEFTNVTKRLPSLRPEVSKMIRNLIKTSVPIISRASVKVIYDSSLQYSVQNDDYSVLGAFWLSLFTSHWHEDQQTSVQLLLTHKGLQEHIEMQIPQISKTFLTRHNIADYQRLLECVLQCNMENSSAHLLRALFDYYSCTIWIFWVYFMTAGGRCRVQHLEMALLYTFVDCR
ncbi:uncharacterized protein LOC106668924 isoform X2 [Cimex lectularius]|uniref:Uncharacterized protein n=1 Tax=Cimex lectularius TaxID=79782 RepID=A0A8I6SFN7_CIMLE|nr:uncharacterized protein LOC106668924 isoform X2 [Cimex lectularius]